MFSSLLIANRGEIACRVIRTARRLGLRTVAVYSEADADAPHVAQADEAVCIGPAPAAASYLNVSAILEAARRTGAQAVHPGYGFLSENAEFAKACEDAGLVFVGPTPQAIHVMGDKAGAKRVMMEAGVPTAPGYLGDDQSDDTLVSQAQALGFPLLVKAVSGGGGRGMRLVHHIDEMPQAITSARREATSAFGDGTLMLERLIENGRHIEIQVFADTHGHVVHLGERDCTAQRRRQKVIEESPSPVVSPEMRERMGHDAILAAKAIGYRGAGTVEFIVDAALKHYFLEMNTRLQVEHPVTEMVTGFDLVEWQLRVAQGLVLPVTQEQIAFKGHAIEARWYAEDPYNGFAPQTGRIDWWRPAVRVANGIRIDAGIEEGSVVSPHYDPMVAKLIVHGTDRNDAISRMMRALDDTPLLGIKHNGRFLRDLVDHPRFRAGSMTTSLIDEWQQAQAPLLQAPEIPAVAWTLAAALFAAKDSPLDATVLRAASASHYDLTLKAEAHTRHLRVSVPQQGRLSVKAADAASPIWVQLLDKGSDIRGGQVQLELDGVRQTCKAIWCGEALHIVHEGQTTVFHEVSAWPNETQTQDPSRAVSPVAGTVAQVLVKPGDAVQADQPLISIEAMKMEMWLCAQAAGTVKAVHVQTGEQVQARAVLVDLELNKEA